MNGSREQRLQTILHAYLQAVQRGEKPDREAILQAHPDLRDALAAYFADPSKLDAMAKLLKTASLGGGEGVSNRLGKVRYFGDYELLEEIARGGMGVVYKAKQVSLNRIVALKMILKGELANEVDVRRFKQEAESAGNLDHPHIVPIYEVGEHEGQHYFSMKFIETAEKRTSSDGQHKIATLIQKVAHAVHHAHQRGILHRDLKPGNILIDKAGEPHVADFGLAKKVGGGDDATRSGVIVGTPAYMAPEQARAEKSLTTAVDIWSLGAILYEWLTGRPPFVGKDQLSTLMKVVEEEPIKPRSIQPKVDRDLETICLKCLDKSPQGRYPSAKDLAEDLDRYAKGEPVVARPPGRLERLAKWARRKPVTAAALGLALTTLVLAGLSAGAFALWRQAEAARVEANKASDRAETARIEATKAGERVALIEYGRTVDLAYGEYLKSNMQRARALLEQCKPELRGWEWRMVHRLCHPELLVLDDEGLELATYSPDGKRIVGVQEGKLREFDAETGAKLRSFDLGDASSFRASALQFSPDGSTLLVSAASFEEKKGGYPLQVWDSVAGKLLKEFASPSQITAAQFNSLGTRIVMEQELNHGNGYPICDLAIWDWRNNKIVAKVSDEGNSLKILAFARDDRSVHLMRRTRKIEGEPQVAKWDLGSNTIQKRFDIKTRFNEDCLAVDNDRGLFVSRKVDPRTGADAVSVWDLGNGKESIIIPVSRPTSAAFSSLGTIAFTLRNGTIEVWQLYTGSARKEAELKGQTKSEEHVLRFHPDGQRVLSSGFQVKARVWNLPKPPEPESVWSQGHYEFALSGDGKVAATFAHETDFAIWDTPSGLRRKKLSADFGGQIHDVALNADGSRMISGSHSKIGRIWDVAAGKVLFELAHENAVTVDRVAMTATGELVATIGRLPGFGLTSVCVWDGSSGRFLRKLDAPNASAVRFSPTGDQLAIGTGSFVEIRNPKTGDLLSQLGTAGTKHSYVSAIDFSPDGHKVIASLEDNSARMWDLATGDKILLLKGHINPIGSLEFSPDGTRILTAAWSDSVKIWDVKTGTDLLTLQTNEHTIVTARWHPNGKALVTSGLDGSALRLWDPDAPR